MKGLIAISVFGVLAAGILYQQGQTVADMGYVLLVKHSVPARTAQTLELVPVGQVAGAEDTTKDESADPPTQTVIDLEGKPVTVVIGASGFFPSSVTVEAGTAIVWENTDTLAHYVTPDDHPSHTKYKGIWDDVGAGELAPGQSYTFIFSVPGTYTYHDHFIPESTGMIIVQ
ncbi:MAG: plastocyanin/azurin family copper-binding protein [Patescibacteria group bacterium]|jgi:plastocyanin